MKLLVLGHKGMLGGMAMRYFSANPSYQVKGVGRNELDVRADNSSYQVNRLHCLLSESDSVINCIGAIKPKFNNNSELAHNIYTNAVFPHLLANIAEPMGKWVVHITTDCVTDGMRGHYTEDMPHTATDAYGMSKSLGEPLNCMVIRTSIIGPEWHGNKRSLVEWLLSKNGGKVDGYLNHAWNGVTTLELCKAIDRVLREDMYEWDNFNLFSTDVNKYQLLEKMCGAWGLNIDVHPILAPDKCDRTIRTVKDWNRRLKPAPIDDMLRELSPYVTTL